MHFATFEGIKEVHRTCTPGTHEHSRTIAKNEMIAFPHLEEKALALVLTGAMQAIQKGRETTTPRDLDLAEFGASHETLTRRAVARGLTAENFSHVRDPRDNPEDTEGRARARSLALRVRSGGVAWFGPPGAWWIWIRRKQNGRTQYTPEGDTTKSEVRRGARTRS